MYNKNKSLEHTCMGAFTLHAQWIIVPPLSQQQEALMNWNLQPW